MIRSYQRVLTKCMTPAKTKNGPNSLLSMRLRLWAECRTCLGDREAPFVECPPDDHALEVVESESSERAQVIEGSDAARVDDVAVGRGGHISQRGEIGTLHQAVDVDGRVDEAPQAPAGQFRDHIGRLEVGSLRPAVGRDLPGAGVDGGDHPVSVRRCDRFGHLGIANRRRAQHHPLRAGRDRLLDLLGVTETPAELHWDVHGRDDAADMLEVDGLSLPRSVEVDDVQPARAAVHPPSCRDDRIVVIARLPLVVALDEPDGLAAPDVDRREKDQLQIETKLRSSPSPAELDFSGWNWTP